MLKLSVYKLCLKVKVRSLNCQSVLGRMEYPLLLEPITLAGRTVRNRVVHASMSTRYTQNQDIDPRLVRYHANRAAGGVRD